MGQAATCEPPTEDFPEVCAAERMTTADRDAAIVRPGWSIVLVEPCTGMSIGCGVGAPVAGSAILAKYANETQTPCARSSKRVIRITDSQGTSRRLRVPESALPARASSGAGLSKGGQQTPPLEAPVASRRFAASLPLVSAAAYGHG